MTSQTSTRKLRIIAVWVIGVGVCVGGSVLLFREGGLLHCWVERCSEGKPASYWIIALQDKDPKVSGKAISALFEIAPRSPEAARLLLAMIKDDPEPNLLRPNPYDEASPTKAALTLGEILEALGPDAKGFIPALTELLREPGVFHRLRACMLLGRMGANARSAIPALTRALSDEFPPVREEAAKALKLIDPEGRGAGN